MSLVYYRRGKYLILLVNSRHIRGGFWLALRRSADTTPNSSETLRQIILKATVMAYNLKRMVNLRGAASLTQALQPA
jgi:hypothetical protein